MHSRTQLVLLKMARQTKPLTDTEIKNAKPREKPFKLFDGQGLAIRVRPNGTKSWIFSYKKPISGKATDISLGIYPVVSLAAARNKRLEALSLLSQDICPKEDRDRIQQERSAEADNTFENVAARWIELKRSQVTDDHADKIWRQLQLHVFPYMGSLPITKVTTRVAIDVLKPVEAKGSLETVKRLCQQLNEIMVYAVNSGITENNCLGGISRVFKKPQKTHYPTLQPSQLPELVHDIHSAQIKKVTKLAILWQLHTLSRPSETAEAQWSEIDETNKLWVIPAERMKAGKTHRVPLTGDTLKILEELKPISEHREFLFPSDKNPRKHINSSTANMALKRMGYERQLVAHGFRALGSTTLNEKGFDPDVIEAALAHTGKNEVRSAYNRADYLDQRRKMMEWWSVQINLENKATFI